MENFNTVPSQGKYGSSIAVVNENFLLAQQKMEMLQAQYNALSGKTQPVVGPLPASGVENTIYRVPGTSSYTEWMWDGTQFVLMSTHDNAIDDIPLAGSENLVKSGGVAESLKIFVTVIPSKYIDSNGDYKTAAAGDKHKATQEYYEVEPNTLYVCNFVSNGIEVTAFYDEDKNFISSVVSGTWSESVWTFTTPSTCKYIRTSHVSNESTPFFYCLKEGDIFYKKIFSAIPKEFREKEYRISAINSALEILAKVPRLTVDPDGNSTDYNNGWIGFSDTYLSPGTIYVPSYVRSVQRTSTPGYIDHIACYSDIPLEGTNTGTFLGSVGFGESFPTGTRYIRFVAYKDTCNNFATWEIRYIITNTVINELQDAISSLNMNNLPIEVVAGWQSSDNISVSITNNIATVVFTYQSGSSWKLFATKIGTVAELKNRYTYLYLSSLLEDYHVTVNRTVDWNPTYTISGWYMERLHDGSCRVVFPPSIFDGLQDTDIIYFLQGTDDYATVTIVEYISTDSLFDVYPDGVIPTKAKIKKIVAWGDSITMAWQRTAYTEYMKEKLPGYIIVNCGVGGETISTIMARQGSDVALIPEAITLPSSPSSSVTIADGTQSKYLTSALDGKVIAPLLQGTGGTSTWTSDSVNPCYLQGIKCVLTKEGTQQQSGAVWKIHRIESGDRNETIPSGTPLILSGNAKYGDAYGAIFFCYQNGGYNNTSDLVEKLKRMVQQANTDKYIVVGTYTSVNTARESALQAAFGIHFFNSRVYLSTNAIYDLGLTPTQEDLALMQQGLIPKTFWNGENDNIHMNNYGYKALGYMFAELFKAQGL